MSAWRLLIGTASSGLYGESQVAVPEQVTTAYKACTGASIVCVTFSCLRETGLSAASLMWLSGLLCEVLCRSCMMTNCVFPTGVCWA